MPAAVLERVEVFRGQPSPEHDERGYNRSQAQRANWQRDDRVTVVLRPLKYEYERDASGRPATDGLGQRILKGAPREKGVVVLCALAAVRAARDPAVDLVILASSDTDLAPALDEVRRLGTAKIETFCWWDAKARRGTKFILPIVRGPCGTRGCPRRRSRRARTQRTTAESHAGVKAVL